LCLDAEGQLFQSLRQGTSSGTVRATQADAEAEESLIFQVRRVGDSVTHHKDKYIRNGITITLKAVKGDPLEEDVRINYLQIDDEGQLNTNGKLGEDDAAFILEQAELTKVLQPVQKELAAGDSVLQIQSPWDKSNFQRLGVQASPVNRAKDMKAFAGVMVQADRHNQYVVPKRINDGWVCIMYAGADLVKAAETIKSQKGCGIIVLVEHMFDLARFKKMAELYASPESGHPCLPVLFISSAAEKEINEKGLLIKGVETRRPMVGKLALALGRTSNNPNLDVILDEVLGETGALLQDMRKDWEKEAEVRKEQLAREEFKRQAQLKKDAASNQTKREWKGKYAQAAGKSEVGVKRPTVKGKKIKVVVMSQEDLVAGLDSLQDELVEATDNVDDLEQLDDSSDFRIEYTVQEMEVAINANTADIQEEEDEEVLAEQEGRSVGKVGIPKRFFWLTILVLALLTGTLVAVITIALRYQGRPWTDEEIRQTIAREGNQTADALRASQMPLEDLAWAKSWVHLED